MEQLGYIALGCVLVLAVLVLLRVDWSKIRLPKFGRAGVGVGARTKNSVLLSIAVHAVLALICALFIVTKEIEHDAINGGVGEDSAADAARKNTWKSNLSNPGLYPLVIWRRIKQRRIQSRSM